MRKRWMCALLLLAAQGCVRVAPWQRETLSKREMRTDPDPVGRKLADHIQGYREGAIGGTGVGGGGCGCN